MTLGGAGALIVMAGLAGTLCACGEPRPAPADGVAADSVVADSGGADSGVADSGVADSATPDSVARDSPAPLRVPADSPVSRPPIMDPAPKDRPPRLPRPDSAGSGA